MANAHRDNLDEYICVGLYEYMYRTERIYVQALTYGRAGPHERSCRASQIDGQGLACGRASSREWTGRVSLGITFCC